MNMKHGASGVDEINCETESFCEEPCEVGVKVTVLHVTDACRSVRDVSGEMCLLINIVFVRF